MEVFYMKFVPNMQSGSLRCGCWEDIWLGVKIQIFVKGYHLDTHLPRNNLDPWILTEPVTAHLAGNVIVDLIEDKITMMPSRTPDVWMHKTSCFKSWLAI